MRTRSSGKCVKLADTPLPILNRMDEQDPVTELRQLLLTSQLEQLKISRSLLAAQKAPQGVAILYELVFSGRSMLWKHRKINL